MSTCSLFEDCLNFNQILRLTAELALLQEAWLFLGLKLAPVLGLGPGLAPVGRGWESQAQLTVEVKPRGQRTVSSGKAISAGESSCWMVTSTHQKS
jgi:hypothetical protein